MIPKLWYVRLYDLPEIDSYIVGDQLGVSRLFSQREYEGHLDMMDDGHVERLPEWLWPAAKVVSYLPEDYGYGPFFADRAIVYEVHGERWILRYHGYAWRFRVAYSDEFEKWCTWDDKAELFWKPAARIEVEKFQSGSPGKDFWAE